MPADTKEQILDAAEQLISEKGIDAVSLRAITAAADVNLAAVHYHFGSKEALVGKVFARRIEPINQERLRLLDEAMERAGDGPLPVEDVLEALIAPAIRVYASHERGALFMRVCGRIYAEQAEYLLEIFEEQFRELVERITVAITKALPDSGHADRAWGLHFAIGAMVHTMIESEKVKKFSGGLCDPSDADATIERMVRFSAAGLRALAENPGAAESVATAVEAGA